MPLGAHWKIWAPANGSLLDLRLLGGAGQSPLWLLPLLILVLLDPENQLLDLVALRLHPLLLKPVGELDGQVETGDGILFQTVSEG